MADGLDKSSREYASRGRALQRALRWVWYTRPGRACRNRRHSPRAEAPGAGGGLPLPHSVKVRVQGGVDTVFF